MSGAIFAWTVAGWLYVCGYFVTLAAVTEDAGDRFSPAAYAMLLFWPLITCFGVCRTVWRELRRPA